jgi:eukaryotic-like serine/threonine-protein kinase
MSTNPPAPSTDSQSEAQAAVPATALTAAAGVEVSILPTPGEVIISGMTGSTYTIEDRIGEGTFGVVYGCVDDWNNRLAAKVLKPRKPKHEMQAVAFAEMQKLVQLRHPQITYFFDAFEYRNICYIITERCEISLAELFTAQWFVGSAWTLAIARCLLQAVQFLHLHGYAHQDIHAGNVFALLARNELVPDERNATQFRLGDLGVAKLFSEISPENTRAQWMLPPEVLNPTEFGAPDQRVDIYHSGMLLLQLEHSKELSFTTDEILAGKPREMALQLRSPLNFALEKSLRRHVSKRTETARELWRDLNSRVQTTADESESEPDAAPSAPNELPAG